MSILYLCITEGLPSRTWRGEGVPRPWMEHDRSMTELRLLLPRRSAGLKLHFRAPLFTAVILLLLLLTGATADCAAEGENKIAIDPSDTLFALAGLEPGDSVTRRLTLTNKGDQPLFLRVINERVSGTPDVGEPGELYAQLQLTLRRGERIIYCGPMCGLQEPLNLGAVIGPLRPGQTLPLDITVSLPGPETGNEFQGSTLSTRFLFLHRDAAESAVPPELPGLAPGETGPSPEDEGSLPELPRTGSGALFFFLRIIADGFLIGTGLLLIIKLANRAGDVAGKSESLKQ